MARIRSIKPEFWADERLGECSPTARLVFIATWTFADDLGNLQRSARQIKAQAFPYDSMDIEPFVKELIEFGLLIEYQSDGDKFLHIKNFGKHQRIDKESKPRFPLYEDSITTSGVLTEPSPTPRPGGEGKGGEGQGEEIEGRGSSRHEESPVDKSLSPSPPLKNGNESGRKNGHDDRSFDEIKDSVLDLVTTLKTRDAEKLHRQGGRSRKLSAKQIRAALKQLHEDGRL